VTDAETAALLLRRPEILIGRRSYILVLSHMRSYSSVLCHILGSHPEIDGYAEMHLRYQGPLDRWRLRLAVSRSLGSRLRGRFVLDKILHSEYGVAPVLLGRSGTYPIFLVRRPEGAVPSIMRLGGRIPEYARPAFAVTYYVQRLRELARLAGEAPSRGFFIRSESVISDTRSTLDSVARFLGLEEPLTESYSIFEHTGEPGWGDASSTIRAGRVVRTPLDRPAAALSEEALARAQHAYAECCDALERHCLATGGVGDRHAQPSSVRGR
jgi:hypothetical protein